MHDSDRLAERFEEHRSRLTAVAYRMLGSSGEADDAVQEAWLRLSRSDAERDREPAGVAHHRRVPGVPEHAAGAPLAARGAAGPRRARAGRRAGKRVRPRARSRCSPTRSDRRCWSCSTRWHPRSASPSSCTTCSPCRSTRSRRSSAAARRRPASSPAARDVACSARTRASTPTGSARPSWSTRSSPPRATATSPPCSPSSTPTSCCAPTRPRCGSARRRRPAGPPASARSPGSRAEPGRRSSTGRAAAVWIQGGRARVVYDFTVSDERIVAIDLIADPERLSRFDLAILGSPGVSR